MIGAQFIAVVCGSAPLRSGRPLSIAKSVLALLLKFILSTLEFFATDLSAGKPLSQ